MTINDNLILRFLYSLDKRDYPKSLLNFFERIGNRMDDARTSAVEELYGLKDRCRKIVLLSQTFVKAMDKSYLKFTQCHIDILEECDGECGVVRSPYFIPGCYVVYSVKSKCLTIWVFQQIPNENNNLISVPTYYIVANPKDRIAGKGHQLDCMVVPMLDNCMEPNLEDYINMVLDYLCLRKWAEVEQLEFLTKEKKQIKDKKTTRTVEVPGLPYILFDSKWYTEVCNNEDFQVSGHFRLQPYGDGSRRLIWINEFTKHGYHRKATIDKVADGEIILD